MNNQDCQSCQNFLYQAKKEGQDCQRYICSECGTVTHLTFQHQSKRPEELMILTNRQYHLLSEGFHHLKGLEKEDIKKVLDEIKRNNP